LEEKGHQHEPFGSKHVIKSGDFHQFPPVGNPARALYMDWTNKDKKPALLGREIFLQFDKVVILNKQNRIKDVAWDNILRQLRVGECKADDLIEIEKLVLTNPLCVVPDFSKPPWDQAILITPRHLSERGRSSKWNARRYPRHNT
jgi:hypothetical protein